MTWNLSLVDPVDNPNGYCLNIAQSALTPEAEPYRITPKSPDCVWAGDPGIPQRLNLVAADGTVTKVANPDWTPDSPKYTTVFLSFPDEATAKAALPALWTDSTE